MPESSSRLCVIRGNCCCGLLSAAPLHTCNHHREYLLATLCAPSQPHDNEQGLLQQDALVMLDDENLEHIDVNTWHKYLGVLQQNYLAYGFATARDNVYYGDVNHPFNKVQYDEALSRAEAKSVIENLPSKEKTYLSTWMEDEAGNNGVDLSGGQWQRVALARNFYRDSPIIILDEPTSAIDALAESRIFKHLLTEKNRTIITISHRLTTVEKADVVYMLKDGQLVEQGTAKELIAKKGEFYTMFESQIK